MKLSNENQMMLNIVPLFGARSTKIPNSENQRVRDFSLPKLPLPCQPRVNGIVSKLSVHSRERSSKHLRERRLKLHILFLIRMMEAKFVSVQT